MNVKSIAQKIIQFPLTKIIIGFLVIGIAIGLGQFVTSQILGYTEINHDIQSLLNGLVTAILAIVAYRLLFKYYEKREITEFSNRRLLRHLILGFAIGAALQSLTILIIYLFADYVIVAVNPIYFIIPPLTLSFTSAIAEEILFRGVLFRIVEEKLGSYISLIISALIFGLLHLANPNSTITAAIGLAIQAGLLLGVSYMYSRNLWFPIAMHFAWNFTETAIFGAVVSGNELSKTLITSTISGTNWVTGGEFGPEGSIQATIFCLVTTAVLFFLCSKEGKIVKPY